ncbi:hypothetical protein ACLMAL_06090 [Nocardia sp. CWNU-33]|uniref:hypothetical protein n=1 Tax=Nocardia sp. CWNU-33 TaxID=3392117 RepID=UPI00398EDE90
MTQQPDSFVARVRFLEDRAEQAGYLLVHAEHPPGGWTLLAAEDGERIYSGSLDQIDAWLKS